MKKVLIRKPLKEEIYDALHRQIIAGKYGPGDWLRQEDGEARELMGKVVLATVEGGIHEKGIDGERVIGNW